MGSGRDKTISRYLRGEVAAHSAAQRARLTTASGGTVPRSPEELAKVRPITLDDLEDPASIMLRPPWPTGNGRRAVKARKELEHRYKPVHWFVQSGVPLGSSAADLERLGRIGARWLSGSGVRGDDVVLGFLPAGPNLAYWELVLGARELGVSTFHVPPVPRFADAAQLLPTVVVGRPADLARLLTVDDGSDPRTDWRSRVRVVIAAGQPLDDGLRSRLQAVLTAKGAVVLWAWAPPGVRAMWWECKGGVDLHTWPDAEIVQVVDPLSATPAPPGADGEIVWTALGWFGSALVRLRTGVFGAIDPDPCPACGGPGPRLQVNTGEPSFLRVLDRNPGVAAWQAELRIVDGYEELLVFLAPNSGIVLPQMLAELDADLGATQYVVLDHKALDLRLAQYDDSRVVDLRT